MIPGGMGCLSNEIERDPVRFMWRELQRGQSSVFHDMAAQTWQLGKEGMRRRLKCKRGGGSGCGGAHL